MKRDKTAEAVKEPQEAIKSEADKKKSRMSWFMELVFVIVLALLVRQYIITPTLVFGNSMVPTLRNGDFLLESRIAVRTAELKRGDIVILDPKDGTQRDFIKRIIAVGGETIRISQGVVSIDGEVLNEPYISAPTYIDRDVYEIEIPEGSYYVMGDNRLQGASNDSRDFGPIPHKSIKGVVFYRYFPLGDSFGKIEGWDYEKH